MNNKCFTYIFWPNRRVNWFKTINKNTWSKCLQEETSSKYCFFNLYIYLLVYILIVICNLHTLTISFPEGLWKCYIKMTCISIKVLENDTGNYKDPWKFCIKTKCNYKSHGNWCMKITAIYANKNCPWKCYYYLKKTP